MNSLIRILLESRLSTWAAAESPAIPVAWENVRFNPPSGRYLRAWLMPAETGSEDLAGAHRRYTGVWQVSVVVPTDTGPAAAGAIAEEIVALYPVNLLLSTTAIDVQIISPMSIHPALQDSDRYTVPISCRYRADTV